MGYQTYQSYTPQDRNQKKHQKIENIKILPGTYKVDISEKLLSRFVNETYDVTYYIALEPDSTFG